MVVRVQVECFYANKILVRKVRSLGYAQCKDAILAVVAEEEDCLDYCGHHWLGPRRLDYCHGRYPELVHGRRDNVSCKSQVGTLIP
jgi:hypothetical protein